MIDLDKIAAGVRYIAEKTSKPNDNLFCLYAVVRADKYRVEEVPGQIVKQLSSDNPYVDTERLLTLLRRLLGNTSIQGKIDRETMVNKILSITRESGKSEMNSLMYSQFDGTEQINLLDRTITKATYPFLELAFLIRTSHQYILLGLGYVD